MINSLVMSAVLSIFLWLCCASVQSAEQKIRPVIFNSSETVKGGEVFGLQGAFFGLKAEVWCAVVSDVLGSLKPLRKLKIVSGSDQQLSVLIPDEPAFQPGALIAVWVKRAGTSGSWSKAVYLNRARAVTLEYDQVMPGHTFRVFGRNLTFKGYTPRLRFVDVKSQKSIRTHVIGGDLFTLQIIAPRSVRPGRKYQLMLSNGNGGDKVIAETTAEETLTGVVAAADPFGLKAPWGAEFTFYRNVYNVREDPRLRLKAKGDGLTDDRLAIQQAIDLASSSGGGVLYFPEGKYKLDIPTGTGLVMKSRVVLKGEGYQKTFIQYGFGTPPPYPEPIGKDGWPNATTEGVAILWPLNTTLTGLYQLCLQNVNTSGLWRHSLKTMPPSIKKPGGSGSKFFAANCRFDFAVAWGLSWAYVDRMMITDCIFDSKARVTWPWLWHCTGATNFVVRNNRVRYAAGRFGFNDSFNGIIENNHITRLGDLINPKGETGGFNIDYAQDIVVLKNRLDVEGKSIPDLNQGETILSQGGNPEQMATGHVSAATPNTLRDSDRNWGPIRTPSLSSSDAVAIIYGKGMGQWRYLKSNTRNTLILYRPWGVIPDKTSRYAVMRWSAEDWLVKDNILEDNNRGIWFYCGSTDVAITGNTLTNSEGIYVRSDQRLELGRYNLSWNVSVCDNKVVNTNGLRPAYVCNVLAIGTKPDTLLGTGSLGVEIRRNLVQAYRQGKNASSFVRGEGYFNEVLPKQGRIMPGMRVTGVRGTIFEGNTAINADVGYRLYGPIDQTVIKSPVFQDVDTPVTTATGTVILEKERKNESALQWKSGGITIMLKDELVHPAFSWPRSLLKYKIDFGSSGNPGQELLLREKETGKRIPFQLNADTLCFMSDLPSGAVKTFELLPASGKMPKDAPPVQILKTTDYYELDNGKIRVQIPAHQKAKIQAPISRYGDARHWLGHGEMQLNNFKRFSVEILAKGPVQVVFRMQYELEGNRRYTVLLKLTAGMEFAELEEKMYGFAVREKLSWKIVWDGIVPDHRYASTRVEPGKARASDFNDWEPMEGRTTTGEQHPLLARDQQNGKDGLLPFRLAPYDNWLSWWRLPGVAFSSGKEKTTIGLFIKDTEKWNDGKYALWGSKKDLNISFHWNNQRLDYTFPLVTGSRSTALAAYPQEKDLLNNSSLAYIDDLRRWHGWIPLDKVKNWILNYETPESGYPRFFKPENATPNLSLTALEQSLSANLQVIAKGSERINGPTPVGSRIYYDQIVPAFDLNAAKMPISQYRRLRAWYLFVSYLYQDEALMPLRNLLSGHPNFMADIKGVTGLAAFLFPKHPDAARMANHFEKMIKLNFNYHIRPDVPGWEAMGGRWTENLATYTWAALTPMVRTNELLRRHFDGKNRILQPGVSSLGNWLLNSVSSPLESLGNRRAYPPQGAHARTTEDGLPDVLRLFAQQLMYYDPKLSKQLLWLTDTNDKPFESTKEKAKVWKDLSDAGWGNYKGINPWLKSAKFTGYGFVLRSAFATKDEMYVHLQQIDEGPNYRWGRAAMGGNGVIYYYANGKNYSHNGPEDAGDGPFGDTERITNFGVKKPGGYRAIGPYRSVGRNDLTEPLYDFGFAQFASVLSNKDIARDYRSRSILQSSSDYIAVFDEVSDPQTEGRFSWFVGANDEFPYIHQLMPGAAFKDADLVPGKSSYHKDPPVLPTKGRYYDGRGSFLTIVTHKPEISVQKTDFGCIVQKKDRQTDLIFRNIKPVQYAKDGISFSGRAGIVQFQSGNISAALFEGTVISIPGIQIELPTGSKAGISIQQSATGYSGIVQSRNAEKLVFGLTDPQLRFYLDGTRTDNFTIPAGKHRWAWSSTVLRPDTPGINAFIAGNIVIGQTPHAPEGLMLDLTGRETRISWGSTPGAETYRLYRISRPSAAGPVKIYEGRMNQFRDQKPRSGLIYDYIVTALNSSNESKNSTVASTDPSSFLNWEPMRGEGFRRDTENHENGFPEFDPLKEDEMPVLVYPINKQK
ncbi:glycosyl hydrolase family 28-related protein [Pedobacter sp. MC2016-15]|uniref:glycosyl hydrolase family 28-related protein n=1 Tax=Pedobacter sp. MC2016-15 TaxID=2994473 RepID=UPI002AFE22B4|nr:glycosyl hydrolase family 28-related protein [Pedobacter sp. MC2016-15]